MGCSYLLGLGWAPFSAPGVAKFRAEGVASTLELKELARQHTNEAVGTLVSIMKSSKAAPAAGGSAANALLDRGYGKPQQHITGEGGPQYVVRLPEPCATVEEWLTTVQTTVASSNGSAAVEGKASH